MIKDFQVLPHYSGGTAFSWEIDSTVTAPQPWVFQVEESVTGQSDFKPLGPPVTALTAIEPKATTARRQQHRDTNFYFRVVAVDGNRRTHVSPVLGIHGTLTRREYLIAKEILRKEALQLSLGSGITVDLYRPAGRGEDCTACVDPVSGAVLDPDCTVCQGTQKVTGLVGPYSMLAAFTNTVRQKKIEGTGSTDDDRLYTVRCLCRPPLIRDDILQDTASDRKYKVSFIKTLVEIRRFPLIQEARVSEESRA